MSGICQATDLLVYISELFVVSWSYKKLCFVILLSYYVVLCCLVDISRGCIQVSVPVFLRNEEGNCNL